jgi:transcriptional regulator with XRE-family HTH domain
VPETIPDVIDYILREQHLSERGLALYLGVTSNAVNGWHRGLRTPPPEYCWKLAARTKGLKLELSIEDVMRAAGHLPPLEPTTPEIVEEASIDETLGVLIRKFSLEEQAEDLVPLIEIAVQLRERRAANGSREPEVPPSPTVAGHPQSPRRRSR